MQADDDGQTSDSFFFKSFFRTGISRPVFSGMPVPASEIDGCARKGVVATPPAEFFISCSVMWPSVSTHVATARVNGLVQTRSKLQRWSVPFERNPCASRTPRLLRKQSTRRSSLRLIPFSRAVFPRLCPCRIKITFLMMDGDNY